VYFADPIFFLLLFVSFLHSADWGVCDELIYADLDERIFLNGPREWIAPEIILQMYWDTKVDIWSFGCCLLHMAAGFASYFDKNRLKTLFLTAIMCWSPPIQNSANFSGEFLTIIGRCLSPDQVVRPSADLLLKNKFFRLASDKLEMIQVVSIAFWFSTAE